MFQALVLSCLFACVVVRAVPVVNVKLSPGAASLPDIVSQIDGLDATRYAAEEAGLARLDAAYADAVANADASIQRLFAKISLPLGSAKSVAASLLAARSVEPDFRVEVSPAPPVRNRIRKQIASIERSRNIEESRLVDQAVGEFQMLVDIFVSKLKSRLVHFSRRGAVFLDSIAVANPTALDVRLLPPDDPFPTVVGLVAGMESRRDDSEDKLRHRIAELEQRLVTHMRALVASAIA